MNHRPYLRTTCYAQAGNREAGGRARCRSVAWFRAHRLGTSDTNPRNTRVPRWKRWTELSEISRGGAHLIPLDSLREDGSGQSGGTGKVLD